MCKGLNVAGVVCMHKQVKVCRHETITPEELLSVQVVMHHHVCLNDSWLVCDSIDQQQIAIDLDEE